MQRQNIQGEEQPSQTGATSQQLATAGSGVPYRPCRVRLEPVLQRSDEEHAQVGVGLLVVRLQRRGVPENFFHQQWNADLSIQLLNGLRLEPS